MKKSRQCIGGGIKLPLFILVGFCMAISTAIGQDVNCWSVMASGGGTRTMGTMTIGVTLGQTSVGHVHVGDHTCVVGFWQNFATGCCIGIRGNVNNTADDAIDILDLTYLVAYMFGTGPEPPCPEEANVNGQPEMLDILDLTYLVGYMFRSGPPPLDCP